MQLLRRKADAHKGDFGHIFILGGSLRYAGAALLCAEAAMRAGAGLVTLGIPKGIAYAIIKHKLREIILFPLPESKEGALSPTGFKKIRDFARRLKVGGVGYYPRYGFVHLDIGKVRYWEKYQYSKKKRNYAKKKNIHKTSTSYSKNIKISIPATDRKKIAYNQKSVKPKK
ncbi:MAG: DUF882 domain-containing protein [Candidatus Omnitrophica bacterium]|nr:DUF882 domain-containing protein [Candidatus Omnitrophota bacterium]